LATLFGLFPFLEKLFADSAYEGPKFHTALATILPHLKTEIVKRSDRVKGFVRFSEEPEPFLLNFTCGRHHLAPLRELKDLHPLTQMVFVGRQTERHRPAILETLTQCLEGESTRPLSLLSRLGFGPSG